MTSGKHGDGTPCLCLGERKSGLGGDMLYPVFLSVSEKSPSCSRERLWGATPHFVWGDISHPLFPRHTSAEGPLASLGETITRGSGAQKGDRCERRGVVGTKKEARGDRKRALGVTRKGARGDILTLSCREIARHPSLRLGWRP